MLFSRIIPVLLIDNRRLVKTLKFEDAKYIGDPINAVKIFNEKEVDELIFLDISASVEGRKPDINYIKEIASECFMPFTYGGGVRNLADMRNIFKAGAEKIAINTAVIEIPGLVEEAANIFGRQSIVVSVDVKKDPLSGKQFIYVFSGRRKIDISPVEFVKQVVNLGAGELLINSIDLDGTMQGYDVDLIRKITDKVNVPVIACGGAGDITDFQKVIKEGGASAAAAGSYFVFCGSRDSILITYPDREDIEKIYI